MRKIARIEIHIRQPLTPDGVVITRAWRDSLGRLCRKPRLYRFENGWRREDRIRDALGDRKPASSVEAYRI